MLPKCIWSIKVIRFIFKVMGEHLNTIDQRQGDRSISNLVRLDDIYRKTIETAIDERLQIGM